MPRNTRSWNSILYSYTLENNNKQFLNQNQIKTITDSINETSIYFCFRLHLHTILYPNKQLLVQSQQQKRRNKVQKTVTDVNMVPLSPFPNDTLYPASSAPIADFKQATGCWTKTCSRWIVETLYLNHFWIIAYSCYNNSVFMSTYNFEEKIVNLT